MCLLVFFAPCLVTTHGLTGGVAGSVQPPQPPTQWSDVKDVSAMPDNCPQFRIGNLDVLGSEDCLYLHVTVPDHDPSELLPVMFWSTDADAAGLRTAFCPSKHGGRSNRTPSVLFCHQFTVAATTSEMATSLASTVRGRTPPPPPSPHSLFHWRG